MKEGLFIHPARKGHVQTFPNCVPENQSVTPLVVMETVQTGAWRCPWRCRWSSRVPGSCRMEQLQKLQDHEETRKVEPQTPSLSRQETACKLTPNDDLRKTQTQSKKGDVLPKPGEKLLGPYLSWMLRINLQVGEGLCWCSGCFRPPKTGRKALSCSARPPGGSV